MIRRFAMVAAAAVLAAAGPIRAQTAGSRGETVYPAAFFVPFAPASALQIVQRTPGFSLDRGDSAIRGFAAAAGNVVINGQRPSAKSDPLETILSRIPASRVLRVEVGPGDLFGSEFAGKAQVLNLVLTGAGGLDGTVEGTVRRAFTGALYPEGSVSALLTRGRSTFNLAVKAYNAVTTEEGFDLVRQVPSAQQQEYRRKINYLKDPTGAVSASWAHDAGENRTAHLNVRHELEGVRLTQHNSVTPASGPLRDDLFQQHGDFTTTELGGDVTRPLAGGGLKLVGLVTRRLRDDRTVQLNRAGDDLLGGGQQMLHDNQLESIGRLVWSRGNLGGWTVEAGAERAFNRLASEVALSRFDSAGTLTRVDLPIDSAVVREHRTEAFVTAGHKLSTRLRTDLALTVEDSALTVSGDVTAARHLRFVKPRAVFDWRTPNAWHAQVSLQRRVAQLQFQDFISSAELNTERINGGNANLLPQRAWELFGFVEHPLLGDGLVRFEAGYNAIQLVQDRVPTPEGFDAPGNLGSGHELILRGRLDVPTARLGVKGGRLSLYGSYIGNAVRDPYTGQERPFSGTAPFVWQVNFRQDRGKLAWGFELSGATPTTFYRRDEIDRNWGAMPTVSAFADYRPNPRTTLTLGVENLTDAAGYRRRSFFTPDRRAAMADLTEFRHRNRHVVPYLGFKRSL